MKFIWHEEGQEDKVTKRITKNDDKYLLVITRVMKVRDEERGIRGELEKRRRGRGTVWREKGEGTTEKKYE